MQDGVKRERAFTWDNPLDGAAKAMQMAGLEYLNAMMVGSIPFPPLMRALDFAVDSIEKGSVTFAFTPQEFHYNPIGSVHGGVITAILDSAMGCSIHSLLPAGTGYTTLEIKVNFLKAVSVKSGLLKATGKIIHAGNRTALVEAQLTGSDGAVYAHAVSTCLIMPGKKEG
jgi:uncharacterized protein (TIGR00369 family)